MSAHNVKAIIWRKCMSFTSIVPVSGWMPRRHMQSNWTCSFGHVSVAQEVECWTLHLVGGVGTPTWVSGSNPGDAGVSHLNLKSICSGVCLPCGLRWNRDGGCLSIMHPSKVYPISFSTGRRLPSHVRLGVGMAGFEAINWNIFILCEHHIYCMNPCPCNM